MFLKNVESLAMENIDSINSFFAYIVILTSIIIGLGITDLLTSLGSIARNWKHIKRPTASLLWTLCLLVGIIQYWWSTWRFSDIEFSFLDYFLTIVITIIFYFLSRIVLPDMNSAEVVNQLEGKRYSLEKYYLNNLQLMCWLAIVLVCLISVQDWVMSSKDWNNQTWYDKLPMRHLYRCFLIGCVVWILVLLSKKPMIVSRLHIVIIVSFFIILCVFIGVYSWGKPPTSDVVLVNYSPKNRDWQEKNRKKPFEPLTEQELQELWPLLVDHARQYQKFNTLKLLHSQAIRRDIIGVNPSDLYLLITSDALQELSLGGHFLTQTHLDVFGAGVKFLKESPKKGIIGTGYEQTFSDVLDGPISGLLDNQAEQYYRLQKTPIALIQKVAIDIAKKRNDLPRRTLEID